MSARGGPGDDGEVPADVLARLRSVCLDLPETHEEQAWTGVRWRVRTRTFAHVLLVASGWPPAYARAVGRDGPALVLMFRSGGLEVVALRSTGRPFFAPPWRVDEVGLEVDHATDWDEVADLVTESYCVVAPKPLVARVVRPSGSA